MILSWMESLGLNDCPQTSDVLLGRFGELRFSLSVLLLCWAARLSVADLFRPSTGLESLNTWESHAHQLFHGGTFSLLHR